MDRQIDDWKNKKKGTPCHSAKEVATWSLLCWMTSHWVKIQMRFFSGSPENYREEKQCSNTSYISRRATYVGAYELNMEDSKNVQELIQHASPLLVTNIPSTSWAFPYKSLYKVPSQPKLLESALWAKLTHKNSVSHFLAFLASQTLVTLQQLARIIAVTLTYSSWLLSTQN